MRLIDKLLGKKKKHKVSNSSLDNGCTAPCEPETDLLQNTPETEAGSSEDLDEEDLSRNNNDD